MSTPTNEQLLATARANLKRAGELLAATDIKPPAIEEALLLTRQGHCALLTYRQQTVGGNPPPVIGD